ncbi:hypothetical protein U0070_010619 [Myodes glareolus]|uniref:Disks large homolog 5 N-terminal domain-containing protein n=1 Tax=Myodes glareolus TaxID=447135 RepID=A0AAW0H8Y0_MYOGA
MDKLFRRTPEQCVPSPGAPATAERRSMEDYQVLEGNTAPACVCIDPPTSQRLPSPPNRDMDAYHLPPFQAQQLWRNHFCRTGRLKEASETGRRRAERSTGKTQTSASLTKQGQQMNKVDELTLQLQMMINERNELRAILANYTNNDVNNRLNSEREELKMDHQKETSELEKFPKEISEASSKCKELTEKTNSYSPPLRENTQMKERVDMLKEDNRKLQQEQIVLQESCEETKRLREEAYEKIYDLLTKQQQEHQRLEEHLQSLLKRQKLVTQQRDLAVKLQHHFTESQTRFEHLQHELEQTTAQESLLQMELLQQEGYVSCHTPANPQLTGVDLYQQVPGNMGCTMISQPWSAQADGTLDMDTDGMAYSVYTH